MKKASRTIPRLLPPLVRGGEAAGEDPNLSASLTEIGQDPGRVLNSNSQQIIDKLAAETAVAMDLGVFGSPTFIGELSGRRPGR